MLPSGSASATQFSAAPDELAAGLGWWLDAAPCCVPALAAAALPYRSSPLRAAINTSRRPIDIPPAIFFACIAMTTMLSPAGTIIA
jgi:hypothetical protein